MNNQKELITIITESVLENVIKKKIEELGASGYTIMDVRGKGDQGSRSGDWQESANIQVEIICSEPLATTITQEIQKEYFNDYAMIVYRTPVRVLRSNKF